MKTSIAAIALATMVTGCAVHPRMEYDDLRYFEIDCANKDAQIRFLQTQISSSDERAASTFDVVGMAKALQGDTRRFETNRRIADRSYDATARRLIWEIRSVCGK